MERKLGWPLEEIESLRQSVLESGDSSTTIVSSKLEHKLMIKIVGKGKRDIRYCQRCGISWPCLVFAEETIERGQMKRS